MLLASRVQPLRIPHSSADSLWMYSALLAPRSTAG